MKEKKKAKLFSMTGDNSSVSSQEFHEVPFLKKFKFKRQDRLFPKVAPAPPTATSAARPVPSASSAPSRPLPEGAPAGEGNTRRGHVTFLPSLSR